MEPGRKYPANRDGRFYATIRLLAFPRAGKAAPFRARLETGQSAGSTNVGPGATRMGVTAAGPPRAPGTRSGNFDRAASIHAHTTQGAYILERPESDKIGSLRLVPRLCLLVHVPRSTGSPREFQSRSPNETRAAAEARSGEGRARTSTERVSCASAARRMTPGPVREGAKRPTLSSDPWEPAAGTRSRCRKPQLAS